MGLTTQIPIFLSIAHPSLYSAWTCLSLELNSALILLLLNQELSQGIVLNRVGNKKFSERYRSSLLSFLPMIVFLLLSGYATVFNLLSTPILSYRMSLHIFIKSE